MIRKFFRNNFNVRSSEGKTLILSLVAICVLIIIGVLSFTKFLYDYHEKRDNYFLEIIRQEGQYIELELESFKNDLSSMIAQNVFANLSDSLNVESLSSNMYLHSFFENYKHILKTVTLPKNKDNYIVVKRMSSRQLEFSQERYEFRDYLEVGSEINGNELIISMSLKDKNNPERTISCAINISKILANSISAKVQGQNYWKFITDNRGVPVSLIASDQLNVEVLVPYTEGVIKDLVSRKEARLYHKINVDGNNIRVLSVIHPIMLYDKEMNILCSIKYTDIYETVYIITLIELVVAVAVVLIITIMFSKAIRRNINDKEIIKLNVDRFKSIYDTIMDTYYKIDLNDNIIDVTPSCKSITGWLRSEILNQSVTKVAGRKSWEKFTKEIYKNEVISYYELIINHKDGHGVYVSINGRVIRDRNGSPEGIAGTIRDISDRKKGEEALIESENKIRILIESASDAIVTTNENSEILEWNRAAELIFGYELDDLKNERIDKIIPKEIQKTVKIENVKKQSEIEHTKTGKSVELIGKRKNGDRFPIEMSIASWVLSKKIYHTLIVRDITKRKEIEAELRDAVNEAEQMNIQLEKIIAEANKWAQEAELANQSKSKFLANMSHEIRTPMNAILGFSELLALDETNPQKQEYLGAVISSGKALLNLINDILDLSKIESGKITLRMEPFGIEELFKEVRMILSHRAEEKGLILQIKFINEIPVCLISDEERIRQVLINLINNSIKFTHHGQIKVVVGGSINSENRNEYDLRFSVEDSGIGIAPKKQDQIFEDFVQADIEDQRKYEGTGLGLSITKKIVEMMGGKITLQSELGVGSKFTISIPKMEISDEILEKTNETTVDLKFNESIVLLVEDNQVNQQLITGYFASTDLNVLIANNGLEGIEMATNHKPDLILMDIQMPIMDGYEAMRRLKRDPDLKSIPILALTASVLEEDRQKIMDCGADGFLRKPISRKDLYIEISRYLKHEEVAEVETKVEEISQDEDINPFSDLPHDVASEIPKIIGYLNETVLPKWKNFEVTLAIDEAAEVASEMIELGGKYALNSLKSFGTEAKVSAESMNLEKLVSSFSSFEDVITIEKSLVQKWLNE